MIDILILVLIPPVASVAITKLAFALIKRLIPKRGWLTVASAAVFPVMAAVLAFYVAQSGRDLHGILTPLLAAIAVMTLPITTLTAKLLTKRHARKQLSTTDTSGADRETPASHSNMRRRRE